MSLILIAVVFFVGYVILKKLEIINQKLDDELDLIKVQLNQLLNYNIDFEKKEHFRSDDIDYNKYIGDTENE